MKLYKKFVVALALLTAAAVFTPSTAEAGPLLDWLRNSSSSGGLRWHACCGSKSELRIAARPVPGDL